MEKLITGSLEATNSEGKRIKADNLERGQAIQHMVDITPCYKRSGVYLLDGSFDVKCESLHPHLMDMTFVFVPNRIIHLHY